MEMSSLKPTLQWRKWQKEYPDRYTTELINSMDRILDTYLEQLFTLHHPNDESIMNCVKQVVLAINNWDRKYEFIETIEREELCEFIYQTTEMKGLDSDEDITENWRDW